MAKNQHKFDDNKFESQVKEAVETVENAVEEGLTEAIKLKKRKREVKEEPNIDIVPAKKQKISETTTSTSTTSEENSTTTFQTPVEDVENIAEPNEIITSDINEEEQQEIVTEEFDINIYESAELLQELGMEKLKEKLQKRSMKCGGSLKERAERLFKIKGVSDLSTLDPKLFITKPQKK